MVTRLPCNGDFRSAPCIELLKQADIVVTNPPFSLFQEFVGQLMEYSKKFLIIGNKNAITYKAIFPLIKDNKIWTGYHGFSGGFWFYSSYRGRTEKFVDGKRLISVPAIWFTNLEIPKRHKPMDLRGNHYYGNEDKYPRYDNYNAINVERTNNIPSDYDGVMGVPVSFMDKYCPEQFEIVGNTEHKLYYGLRNGDSHATGAVVNGKRLYKRILIRRKKQKAQERGEKNLESKARLFIKPDVLSEKQDLERIEKTMTVGELTKYLSQYKDDTPVYLIDYLYNYDSYLLRETYYAPVTKASFQEHGDE